MLETKLILLVLLGPVAAVYDFVNNPAAPLAIFTAQFEEAFGRPPSWPIVPPLVKPKLSKRVFITHE
jgi:hypothetical protein